MPTPTRILVARVRRHVIEGTTVSVLCTHPKDAHDPERCWLELSDELDVTRFADQDEVILLPAADYRRMAGSRR